MPGGCSPSPHSLPLSLRWAPYLAILPQREPLPLAWSGSEQALLAGTELVASISADVEQLQKDYETHIEPLTALYPASFPAAAFSLAAYVDARTLTASRGFAVDAHHGQGMVPFADLFNHETQEDVHFTGAGEVCACCGMPEADDQGEETQEGDAASEEGPEEDGVTSEEAHFDAEMPPRPLTGTCPLCSRNVETDGAAALALTHAHATLSMVCVRDVSAGCEIFNTYGERGNGSLLHMFGFTLASNPHASVCLDASLVLAALAEGIAPHMLAARLRLAVSAELVADAAEHRESFEVNADDATCPFQRELLLLINVVCCSQTVADDIAELLGKLEADGSVAVQTLDVDDQGDPVCEEATSPPEVLWQIFSNAAVVGGYGAEARQGDADKDAEEEEEEEEEEVSFLLRAPGVAQHLRAALALREGLYPTPSTEHDVQLLECTWPRGMVRHGQRAPPAVHAIQLRLSERAAIAAARALLDTHCPAQQLTAATKKRVPGGDAEQEAPTKRAAADASVWALFD